MKNLMLCTVARGIQAIQSSGIFAPEGTNARVSNIRRGVQEWPAKTFSKPNFPKCEGVHIDFDFFKTVFS